MVALIVETWIWYAVVTFVFVCRFTSRTLHLGSIKALQIDDWLMWFALATYTIVIVTLNITANVNTNLFEPGFDVSSLTAQGIRDREYGSKMVLVVEQAQCITIWTAKACILIMYLRLTNGRFEHYLIQALAAYTAVTFLIMEILYLGVWCRPFYEYWQVPTSNVQCNTALHHLITNAVFNLSSDVALLCIAIPMFLRTQMPPRKKAALVSIFSLGIFVIICAILSKYYSFTHPFGSEWTFWYCRESSTSMLVANIPFVYTLLRRVFGLSSLDGNNSHYGSRRGSRRGSKPSGPLLGAVRDRLRSIRADDETALVKAQDRQGITKEVGVTFASSPAWSNAVDAKGNIVTITGGEILGMDIEMGDVERGRTGEYGVAEGAREMNEEQSPKGERGAFCRLESPA